MKVFMEISPSISWTRNQTKSSGVKALTVKKARTRIGCKRSWFQESCAMLAHVMSIGWFTLKKLSAPLPVVDLTTGLGKLGFVGSDCSDGVLFKI